jgi:exodeoxyribonuclease VIII
MFHLKSYLDSPPAPPSQALIIGSATDCLIFEPDQFDDQFVIMPELNLRTKEGRETKATLMEECAKESKRLISMREKQQSMRTALAIRSNPFMIDLMKSGTGQAVFTWKDPVTGLWCKCKPDWYDPESGTMVDLKTARCAAPNEFSKSVGNYRYHVQDAFYTDGARANGFPVNRFIFAVMEKPPETGMNSYLEESPELMAFYELEQEDKDAGRDSYMSDLSAINFCMMNDEWAGYTDQVITISRPSWSKRDDMEATGL